MHAFAHVSNCCHKNYKVLCIFAMAANNVVSNRAYFNQRLCFNIYLTKMEIKALIMQNGS